jgi:hypothetical protein
MANKNINLMSVMTHLRMKITVIRALNPSLG